MALTVGPDAVSDVPETVVLPMGRTKVSVRVADYPETVVRGGGEISVVARPRD